MGCMKPIIQSTACCNTDIGIVRPRNEDTCYVNSDEGYFLVADGMGSSAGGKMAGVMFKESVVEGLTFKSKPSQDAACNLINDCFQAANSKIISHVDQVPAHSGMGCTAELIVFHESGFTLGHVGDSRTYRLRQGQLKQLTSDHTFIQEQLNQGLILPGQYRNHPMSHAILRAVGISESLEVDLIHGTVLADDIFLLCTDGLSNMVKDGQIQEILAVDWPLDVRATMLIDQANYAGGEDNITVALVQVNKQP